MNRLRLPVAVHVDLVGNNVESSGKKTLLVAAAAAGQLAAVDGSSQQVDYDVQVLLQYLKALAVDDTVNENDCI